MTTSMVQMVKQMTSMCAANAICNKPAAEDKENVPPGFGKTKKQARPSKEKRQPAGETRLQKLQAIGLSQRHLFLGIGGEECKVAL